MSAATWLVGVPAAIGAAASFGGAGLLQHHATQEVPEQAPLRARLLVDLLRIPSFRYGVVCAAVGFALQIVGLHAAPLAIVQPLLVTGVLFYLGYATAFLHRRPDPGLFGGAVLAVAGLATFLLVASPSPGSTNIGGRAVVPLAIGLGAVVLASLFVASRLPHRVRALALAVATAIFYGVTAGLVRSLVTSTGLGVSQLLTHWQLYALVVVGPLGFLLNQNAFQEGTLGSVAVAIITVGDPLVSIGLGMGWFGDSLKVGPAAVAGEVAALAVMAGGIVLLTRHAQQVAEEVRAGGRRPSR